MKESRIFRPNSLILDVSDYLFTEWLVRRGLYSKFANNYTRVLKRNRTARHSVRDHVKFLIDHPLYSIDQAIVLAFPWSCTPEGFAFWRRVSDDWRRFCNDFFCK